MSPPPPPAAPDPDELASAVVDGLLSPADAEAALRDPAVAQRVERLEHLRSSMRAAPPAPAHLADRMIANAIAATQAERSPEVVPFRPHTPAPAPARRGQLAPWLAAAAAILVVGLVAIGLLAQRGGDDAEDQATSAEAHDDTSLEDSSESESGGEGGATEPKVESEAPAAKPENGEDTSQSRMTDLGSFANADELARDVESRLSEGEGFDANAAEDPPDSVRESCSGLTQAGDPDRGPVIFAGTATYKDNPVVVHVYESDGERRLVATDRSCSDVVNRLITGG